MHQIAECSNIELNISFRHTIMGKIQHLMGVVQGPKLIEKWEYFDFFSIKSNDLTHSHIID